MQEEARRRHTRPVATLQGKLKQSRKELTQRERELFELKAQIIRERAKQFASWLHSSH